MPVCGLVVTLEDGPAGEAAARALASHPGATLGERRGCVLPVVLESADAGPEGDGRGQGSAGARAHRWVESLEGVRYADVAFVGFDVDDASGADRSGREEAVE